MVVTERRTCVLSMVAAMVEVVTFYLDGSDGSLRCMKMPGCEARVFHKVFISVNYH
jgi:hypothetical protein